MRCYPEMLPTSLNKILPFYLLYGSETFLIENSLALIKQSIEHTTTVEYLYFSIDAAALKNAHFTQQKALFSSIRCIEIRLNENLNQQTIKVLNTLCNQTYPDTIFLIVGHRLKQATQSKWFAFIQQKGLVVPHWPLNAASFLRWVTQHAKRKGLHCSPKMYSLLALSTQGNCLAADAEIERLALYYADSPQPIHSHDCEKWVQFEVFDLCHAALERRPTQVITTFYTLKQQTTLLPLLLWALTQTIRTLLYCAQSKQEDHHTSLQKMGIQKGSYSFYLKALKHIDVPLWSNLLLLLAKIEKQLKTENAHLLWETLLNISLSLAGAPLVPTKFYAACS